MFYLQYMVILYDWIFQSFADSSYTQKFKDSEGEKVPEIIDVTTDAKPHVSKLPDEEDSCEDLFATNKNAECILYDSTSKCNDRRFKALHSGGLVSYIENMWMHLEVDSISVRKGCRLTVFTGIFLILTLL